MVLQVYVDEKTAALLRRISEETGRQVEELAEAAVADEAVKYFRDRNMSEVS